MTGAPVHIPVMAAEVAACLSPRDGDVMVDATFGAGGYTRRLLEAADVTVWGIDRDPEAQARGRALAAEFPGRIEVLAGPFSEMEALLAERGVAAVDGIAFDLGVSSPQLDDAARGFSFMRDGPLDMRMSKAGPSAADVVNETAEAALADIIYRLGEERKSRRVAGAIVRRRAETPFARTADLAAVVAAAVGGGAQKIHPATRTFQALRLYVNDELGELDKGLVAAERLLAPGGRLAVVSFHSLEDRRVKRFLQARCGRMPRGSRHLPGPLEGGADGSRSPTFSLQFNGAKGPTEAEAATNPRARSAKLRGAVRTDAPAWTGIADTGEDAA